MQANSHIVLAALDESDNSIIILQPEPSGTYRIVGANATFSRATGHTRKEALGTPLSLLHGPSTNADMQRAMDDAMRTGKRLRGEIEYMSRTGRAFWFGFTLLPVVDPATRCLHCVIMGMDITEKRQRDLEQSAMQVMLASVFQKVSAAVVIVRSNGLILLANPAFQMLLGYRADELIQLTTRQLTAPEYQERAGKEHASQLATGQTYEMDLVTIRKDGTHIPVHLTSVLVQRADVQRFRVVTLQPTDPLAAPASARPPTQAVLGCIQFLGLDSVVAAYGTRWAAMRDRLLLAAERILKRRLSGEDVFSRTADQGFSIWFKHGTEEENADRMARIGREIRVMLLGELGEDADLSVSAYTQVTELPDSTAPQSEIMASLNQRLSERRREVEQQARELLVRVMEQHPRELTPFCDSSGQPTRASFVDLPRDLRGKFSAAMSLAGGAGADIDAELFRLGLAAAAILEDVSQGHESIHFVTLPFGLFMGRNGRERFLQQWRSLAPPVQQRLKVMVSELPVQVSHTRVIEVAELLRSIAKGVSVLLDDIEALPFTPPTIPFSLIGVLSASLATTPDAKLRGFILRMHQAKARVLIRLSPAETPQRWLSLGADLTAAS